ncbi:hypothetical protein [Streptomyces violaceusniger]|uniref:Uncharacterized protein n=1 Tax=Streptomyces violaceusniger (strain Tu 4113) TaxID=653045 RepID=G2PHT7_STRV4|nr:hypothetical protein [Streptomyces violaceusniger]AEM88888.1 hypothetical protein Strvi_0112 [Streptomyces violaceusniger Tu 4113]
MSSENETTESAEGAGSKAAASSGTNKRQSPWVRKDTWYGAKARADEAGADFAADMRDLVTAYADGQFDIDPREIPEKDPSRAGRALFPTEDGWKRAKARAYREHGASGSVLAECIALRYMKGQVKVQRTVTVTEAQPVRRNLLNQDGGDGKGSGSPKKA